MIKIFIIVFLLLIQQSCTSQRKIPDPVSNPNIAQDAADISQEELVEEVGATVIEEDILGIERESTDLLEDIIPELSFHNQLTYMTGVPGWIVVDETRMFPNSIAPDDAKNELLQLLRNEAVTKKVGTSVEINTLLTDVMAESGESALEHTAWSGFFRSTVSGMITQEEVLIDSIVPFPDKGSYEKIVHLKAYVEPVSGQRDPAFKVEATLENNMLKAGDELIISITPSEDCYLYVINLLADHTVFLVFPNNYMLENRLKAGQSVRIPDKNMRHYIRFRVGIIPGEELTTEYIYIVCTKNPVSVAENLPLIGNEIPISGNSKSFIDLQRWLTSIPLGSRVEKNLIYHIGK